jgi:hypothetical protein
MSLQNQLEESLKSQELLQSKNEELLKVIENQKDENKKFTSIFKDKDQTLLDNKQQFDIEMTRVKIGMYLNYDNSHIFLKGMRKLKLFCCFRIGRCLGQCEKLPV